MSGQRTMESDHVGSAENLIQLDHSHSRRQFVRHKIVCQHSHAEGLRRPRHGTADLPKTYHAQRQAVEFDQRKIPKTKIRRTRPPPGRNAPAVFGRRAMSD